MPKGYVPTPPRSTSEICVQVQATSPLRKQQPGLHEITCSVRVTQITILWVLGSEIIVNLDDKVKKTQIEYIRSMLKNSENFKDKGKDKGFRCVHRKDRTCCLNETSRVWLKIENP